MQQHPWPCKLRTCNAGADRDGEQHDDRVPIPIDMLNLMFKKEDKGAT